MDWDFFPTLRMLLVRSLGATDSAQSSVGPGRHRRALISGYRLSGEFARPLDHRTGEVVVALYNDTRRLCTAGTIRAYNPKRSAVGNFPEGLLVYVVAQHLGQEAPYSAEYLTIWGTKHDALRAQLEAVSGAATHMTLRLRPERAKEEEPEEGTA